MCDRYGAYGAAAYAWRDGKIALCEPWTTKGAACQRVVVIHEHFHAAGRAEVTNPPDVDQALESPDYMAGLVSKRNSGNSDRCDR